MRTTRNRSMLSAFCSHELGDRLHRYAIASGVSKSQALRELLSAALDQVERATPAPGEGADWIDQIENGDPDVERWRCADCGAWHTGRVICTRCTEDDAALLGRVP